MQHNGDDKNHAQKIFDKIAQHPYETRRDNADIICEFGNKLTCRFHLRLGEITCMGGAQHLSLHLANGV